MKKILFGFWLFVYTALAFAGVAITPNGGSPYFQARSSVSQVISAGTNTKVAFSNKDLDTTNAFDNVTNYRFTPKLAGTYYAWCNLQLQVSSTNGVYVLQTYIFKNGAQSLPSTIQVQSWPSGTGTAESSVPLSGIVSMNGTTDYLECIANINSGTTPTVISPSFFGAYYIGP
jgi:hypothetical protein